MEAVGAPKRHCELLALSHNSPKLLSYKSFASLLTSKIEVSSDPKINHEMGRNVILTSIPKICQQSVKPQNALLLLSLL